MASRTINTRVVISATDNMSPVVGRAADRSISSLNRMNRTATAISSGAFGTGRATAGISAAIAAPLIYAGKQAVDFEDKMADVGKVTDLVTGSVGLRSLGEDVKDLSEYLAVSATDAAGLYASLAQGGIAKENLREVGKIAGQIGVAFDMASENAGDSFMKIQNALGTGIKETAAVFDSINFLSDRTAAKAQQITTFLTSGGAGVAKGYGMGGAEIAAFGSALIGVGKSGEEAATLTERLAKGIFNNAEALRTYRKAGRGAAGFMAVLQKGADLKTEEKQTAYFDRFGLYGNEIKQLATNMSGPGGLTSAYKLVGDASGYADSAQKEFQNRMSTTKTQIRAAWVGIQRATLDAGETMLPVLRDLVKDVKPLIVSVGQWVKDNPELTKTLLKGAAGLAIFSAGVSAVSFSIGGVATTVGAVTTVFKAFSAGGILAGVLPWISSATGALWGLAAPVVVMGAPLWVVAAAVAGIGYGLYYAYDKVEWFREAIERLTAGVQAFGDHFGAMWSGIMSGDWSKVKRNWGAVELQTNLNTASAMNDWKKTHPEEKSNADKYRMSPQRLAEIDRKRNTYSRGASPYSGKGGTGRNAPNEKMPFSIAPRQTVNSLLTPNPVGGGSGGVNIDYKPIINYNGGATEADKKGFAEMLEDHSKKIGEIVNKQNKRGNAVKFQ